MAAAANKKVLPENNVAIVVEGTKLIITIELENVATHLSKSEKNVLIATTSGNRSVMVPGTEGLKLGLNCYRSPSR